MATLTRAVRPEPCPPAWSGAEQLLVKLLDPFGGPPHVEFEVGHAEVDRANRSTSGLCILKRFPRAVTATLVIVLGDLELGTGQLLLDAVETLQQCLAVRRSPGRSRAQHPGIAGGQVKLALADIDPHVGEGRCSYRARVNPSPVM